MTAYPYSPVTAPSPAQQAAAAIASPDPTGTQSKRERWIGRANRRWEQVRGAVRHRLENDDRLHPDSSVSEAIRIGEFDYFLEAEIDERIIQPTPPSEVRRGQHWTGGWIEEAYIHGVKLADGHLVRSAAGNGPPSRPPEYTVYDALHSEVIERQRQRLYDDIRKAGRDAFEDASRTYGDRISERDDISLADLIATPAETDPSTDGVNDRLDAVGQTGTREAIEVRINQTVNQAAINRYEAAGVTELGVAIETHSESSDPPQPAGSAGSQLSPGAGRTQSAGGRYRARANQKTGAGATAPTADTADEDEDEDEDADADTQLEIETAGDERVCARCLALSGAVFSPNEAYDMLPQHPGCRCFLIPSVWSRKTTGEPS